MGENLVNWLRIVIYLNMILDFTGKSLSFCRTWGKHIVYKNCSECQKQFLSSYCGLVDAKIRASDKDLPVYIIGFKS